MSEYFLKPISLGENVKVKLDLSNYATKADFKNATEADTSVLANLKSDVDKLDFDKLKNIPCGLNNLKSKANQLDIGKLDTKPFDVSKLSNVVRNYVFKKDLCNSKVKIIEDKIPNITNLGINTTLDAKRNEIKNEIPSITNLAATTTRAAVNNKIPDVSNLVKKTDYNTKIGEIKNKITTDHDQDKCITAKESNKLTAENFTARLTQVNFASKSDIFNFVKKTLNELSKQVKAILTKGLTKDFVNQFSILNGAQYFSLGVFQNY